MANANVVAANIKAAGSGATAAGKSERFGRMLFPTRRPKRKVTLIWGAVPIIYDNSSQISDSFIRRNNLADAWKFMINDLTWAENNLPASPIRPARVTKWSAEGMLIALFLARSGLAKRHPDPERSRQRKVLRLRCL